MASLLAVTLITTLAASANPPHNVIVKGTPLSLGQYCTAVVGSSTDPQCMGQLREDFKTECESFAPDMQYVRGNGTTSPQDRCIVRGQPTQGASEGGCGTLNLDLPGVQARATCEEIAAIRRRQAELLRQQNEPGNATLRRRLENLQDTFRRMVEQGSVSAGLPNQPGSGSTITGAAPVQLPGAMSLGRHQPTDAYLGPAPASQSRVTPFGVWIDGFADREWRDGDNGANDGGTANSAGVLGGAYYAFRRLLAPKDVFALGVFSGISETTVKYDDQLAKMHLQGPSAGIYAVYVHGQFALNAFSKWDFLEFDLSDSPVVAAYSADVRNYTADGNVSYRLQAGRSWIEPTAGVRYSVTNWNDGFSSLDGHSLRVQGGVRVGTTYNAPGVIITPSVTGLLYSDVVVHGYTFGQPGFPTTPSGEGKLWEQAILKLNFDFGSGLSTYVEGDVRHGDLGDNRDAVGVGGRVGLQYRW